MYDLFFISFNEPNATDNWLRLKSKFKHAKRIHGIEGIGNAHIECAKRSFTKMFWTVDGDTIVDDGWNFDYLPPLWDQEYLHLWYSRNPANELVYGYGAIKLWPKNRVLKHKSNWIDFTTSVGNIKIIETPISITMFNSSPFEAWKSSFRESVKLLELIRTNSDNDALSRLEAWKNPLDCDNSDMILAGAADAIKWYDINHTDIKHINDFNWLYKFFNEKYNQ